MDHIICIDGPGGSGKGTISQSIAEQLNWNILDSGALYRVLAIACETHGVLLDNQEAVTVLAAHLDVQFLIDENKGTRIILEAEDVTDRLRTEQIGNSASKIASIESVRDALLQRQRAFYTEPGLVTDGRDMGTVVFPNAGLKVFLTASVDERARRRQRQLKLIGNNDSIATLSKAIQERDERDRTRKIAPLVPANDAIEIDTTSLSIEQVVSKVMTLVKERF